MRQTNGTIIAALGRGGVLLAAVVLIGAGCNMKPRVPRTYMGRKVEVVAVNPADAVEVEAAKGLQAAATDYRQSLVVLQAYYESVGAIAKERWSRRELENLDGAQTWDYAGIGEGDRGPGRTLEGATEADLVEQVIAARNKWKTALADLQRHYQQSGSSFKLALVARARERFDPVREYSYFLSAEVPPPTLKPRAIIPAAEDIYQEALSLHQSGKLLPLVTSYNKQRRALQKFRRLIYKYPDSTRIAQSAYYIGEIYKEYFNENVRAVSWYERAWQWHPTIQLPARSQAAFVHDIRLAHYARALELYHQVIKHETFAPDRLRYAYQRIEELSAKRK